MRPIVSNSEVRDINERDVLHVSWHGNHGAYDLVTVYLETEQVTGLVKADDAEPDLPAA
jgi:hypothetical protein